MAKEKKEKKAKTTGKVLNAYVISKYFGFEDLDIPNLSKEELEQGEHIRRKYNFSHDLLPPIEEPIAMIRHHKEEVTREGGAAKLLYCENNITGSSAKKPKKDHKKIGLHIIGTPKSIAEAILIKTSMSILEEEGYDDICVEINHLGDKDAMALFYKELTAYYRGHINNMDTTCREAFKEGLHSLVLCKDKLDPNVVETAPSPLNFISEDSRDHLGEVLEYLENHGVSYEINKDIIGDPHYSSDTVFSIIDNKTGKILASGSRFNNLALKAGTKTPIPSASVVMEIEKPKEVSEKQIPTDADKDFYFIQVSHGAKLKSLQVIEMLRKADIPVHQALSRNKLGTQLQKARKLGVSHILLMGQKEAKDGTVLVRDVTTHKQEPIPIGQLVSRLKALRKK